MKTLFATLMVFSIALSTQAQKVKTDYDKSADFTKYKTFTFLGWQNDSDQIMNDLDKKRMRDAFKSELQARNLEMVEEGGDMAISLFIVVNQKTSTSAHTNYNGGMGYGSRRAGWGWNNGYSTTTYTESDYLEGTLVMDVFDGASQDLVWEGIATGTVTQKPEKREKTIPKAVAKLMKKFPVNQAEK